MTMSVAFKLSNIESESTYNCVSLDVGFLNRNTFGDKALRNEIIGLFLAQLDGVKKAVSLSIDQSTWHFTSHTLKGAAAAVGACQIVALADDWGKICVPENHVQREHCKQQLEICVSAFKSAVDQLQ
jgi:HPt (histidine-containing phosphotransfer) domain-containing protein